MFCLTAGRGGSVADDRIFLMARALRGTSREARVQRAGGGYAAAAALKPHFVPEDAFDRQPLYSQDRLFVCQARIDNRDELMPKYLRASQRGGADSALLAEAYDRLDVDCVHEIVGDFAFAAWDRRQNRVVAAVDPLGARRLFWARVGDGLAIAAQLPALLAHPDVSHEPDLGALATLLHFGIDRTKTAFAEVHALPGGHRLIWRGGGDPEVVRWWNPERSSTIRYRDPRDYAEEARALLDQAVRAQLRSATPVSTTLSGGLDSGCVTSLAARDLAAEEARLTAYTSVPEAGLAPSRRADWEPDDRGYAAEVAAGYPNIDHRLVAPGGRCTLDVSARIHARSGTPVKSATNFLWLDAIGAAMAESGSRVLLVGQQGNAAFSWRGENPVWELARTGRLGPAWAQARLEAKGRGRTLAHVLAGSARGALMAASGRRHGASISAPGQSFLASRHRAAVPAASNEYRERAGTDRYWAAFATTPRHSFSAEPVLQWGVEWRDPTADRRLLERLLRYPQSAFRLEGRPRGLAREVAAGLLPDRVRLRTTQGAQVPEAPSLIAHHAQRYAAAIEQMRSSRWCRELLDLDALGHALCGFAAGGRDYYRALAFDRAMDVGLFLASLEQGQ